MPDNTELSREELETKWAAMQLDHGQDSVGDLSHIDSALMLSDLIFWGWIDDHFQ